ncbi:hypothetical protein Hdeb2414_s0041g00739291 [Helianthus debilis subsp. tardiflorus]
MFVDFVVFELVDRLIGDLLEAYERLLAVIAGGIIARIVMDLVASCKLCEFSFLNENELVLELVIGKLDSDS